MAATLCMESILGLIFTPPPHLFTTYSTLHRKEKSKMFPYDETELAQ
jgi:hypothetical protein